jgi:hypothetical protein
MGYTTHRSTRAGARGVARPEPGHRVQNKNADVQKLWNPDVTGYIVRADRNWPAVMEK